MQSDDSTQEVNVTIIGSSPQPTASADPTSSPAASSSPGPTSSDGGGTGGGTTTGGTNVLGSVDGRGGGSDDLPKTGIEILRLVFGALALLFVGALLLLIARRHVTATRAPSL